MEEGRAQLRGAGRLWHGISLRPSRAPTGWNRTASSTRLSHLRGWTTPGIWPGEAVMVHSIVPTRPLDERHVLLETATVLTGSPELRGRFYQPSGTWQEDVGILTRRLRDADRTE